MSDLIIPVRRKWFEQIKVGTKTEEYRERKPYWTGRLIGHQYDRVIITLGYPSKWDWRRRLIFRYYGYVMKEVENEEFGGTKYVYAIQLNPQANDIPCAWCGNQLRDDEKEFPQVDNSNKIICDDCHREHYMDTCNRCLETVDKDQLDCHPGRLIAVWQEAPCLASDDLQPGYYRVKSWPMYADGMIEGYFYSDALERVTDLDEKGVRGAGESNSCSGPLCLDCQGEIEKLLKQREAAL